MEEKINEMLDRICHIEEMLDDRYKFKNDEKSIEMYLLSIKRSDIINVGCTELYNLYKLTTKNPACIRKFNGRVKDKFKLNVKHTTKNKKNYYFWSE